MIGDQGRTERHTAAEGVSPWTTRVRSVAYRLLALSFRRTRCPTKHPEPKRSPFDDPFPRVKR